MMNQSSHTHPMDQADSALPLAGMRVLDLATGSLARIGQSLAELGADVILIEPPSGAAYRRAGRMVCEISLDFALANRAKRSVALDLALPADRASFERLLATADILIETTRPGSAEAALLNSAAIHAGHPALVILSASDFGQTGPFSRWRATGPVLHALSGELSRSGIPGRAPLLPPGNLAYECAVAQAVFVILLATCNRLKTGRGDHLDFSLLDAVSQALDPGYGIAGSATAGVPASKLPRGRPEARHLYPIIPCADGFVRICVLAPRQWQGMFEWMGRPEAFADPSFNLLQTRFGSATLIPAIAAFFADKTRLALEQEGQRHGVPTAAVLNLDEALTTDQVRARAAFIQAELAPGLIAPAPAGVIELDGLRAGTSRPAPGIGEHTDQVLAGLDNAANTLPEPDDDGGRPLTGLRVLDFGVIVVGAEQGRLLADQGASVIKVENAAFPDGTRQSRSGGAIPVTFAAGHRNKRSLGLNLRDPQGHALLLELVKTTDVILSNFKAGTLESLGLDYASLRRINPAIIVVDSSAFGATGPWSGRLGYGPLVRASAGLTTQWRYPGEPDSFCDAITVYPDHVAARVGIGAVLALLIRRRRTGAGGAIGISQSELMLSHMATQIAATALEAAGHTVSAAEPDAPWGLFPCAGDDDWCTVTISGDSEFHALCRTIGRPDLAADTALASLSGRQAARARIDAALVQWLASRTSRDAMEVLQAAGVPAGAMLRVSELPDFPYFVQRGFFRQVTHPHLPEPFHLETAPVRSVHLPDPPERPAPLMGEHTIEIASELLRLSRTDIDRLIAGNVLQAS